jgi:hypothetical protein
VATQIFAVDGLVSFDFVTAFLPSMIKVSRKLPFGQVWQSTFNMENRQCYGVRNSCEPIVSVFVTGKMAMVFPHKMAMLTIFG